MAASQLNINLQAVTANYRYLDQYSSSATHTGAAVKADAYGLGMVPVSKALYDAGCRQFFTAQLSEAIVLRQELKDENSQIFVLEGPQINELADYQAFQLTPVLNTPAQIDRLTTFNQTQTKQMASAVHIDTAMNRLGLGKSSLDVLSELSSVSDKLPLCLVMSHLACADDPEDELNKRQMEAFTALSAPVKDTPKSLSNSAGILLGEAFHFDLTRPGISLYGAMADPASRNSELQSAFTWQADILQIRTIEKGETVGYGADFTAHHRTKLATIGVGYADGYARTLYHPDQNRVATVGIGGYAAPLAGRVSMDLIVVDVSDIPEHVLDVTSCAELIWAGFTLEDMALTRQTIAYEVMTGLGGRVKRHYDEPHQDSHAESRPITPKKKA